MLETGGEGSVHHVTDGVGEGRVLDRLLQEVQHGLQEGRALGQASHTWELRTILRLFSGIRGINTFLLPSCYTVSVFIPWLDVGQRKVKAIILPGKGSLR